MIIRTPGRERYVTISKIPLEDARLSWKARGLLSYLLSKPDNWTVIVKYLIAQAPDGRASVMSALGELRATGYLRSSKKRTDDGTFDGTDWEIFEEPCNEDSASRLSARGFPARGESAPNEDIQLMNTDETISSDSFDSFFAELYEAYPRHEGRKLAERNVRARLKAGAVKADLMSATTKYAASKFGEDIKFIKLPATFFGRDEPWREWVDALPANPVAVTDLKNESAEFEKLKQRQHQESTPMPEHMKRKNREGLKL